VPADDVPEALLPSLQQSGKYPVLIAESLYDLDAEKIRNLYSLAEQGCGLLLSFNPISGNEKTKNLWAKLFDLHLYDPDNSQRQLRQKYEGGFDSLAKHHHTYEVYCRWNNQVEDFPVSEGINPSNLGWTVPGKDWIRIADAAGSGEDGGPILPLIAYRIIGKGKVVFTSSSWGIQYESRNSPCLSLWMKNLVQWLTEETFPIKLESSRDLYLGYCRSGTDDGWIVYLVNQIRDRQNKRLDWWEMMKVNEKPVPIGEALLKIKGAVKAETLFGCPNDSTEAHDGWLHLKWNNFCNNTVLHIIT
jgi:hypothetical protein